jgi:hypothetical protein
MARGINAPPRSLLLRRFVDVSGDPGNAAG